MGDIADRLKEVEKRLEKAALKSGRKRSDILLVAVTKTHPPEMINEAIEAGVTDIGENKPQEGRDKYGNVKPVNWHLIGHLQTNKVKYVIDKCCMIHSVDSIKLMDEIDSRARQCGKVMDILIQVNISGEESKSGISPDELDTVLKYAANTPNLKVKGLMTIAPNTGDSDINKLHFKNMHKLFSDIKMKTYKNVSMDCLSMGMSGDFEDAIECGANIVRIGSAIFGKRDYTKIGG